MEHFYSFCIAQFQASTVIYTKTRRPVKPAKNLSTAFWLQFIDKSLKIEGKRSGAESRGRKIF